MKKWDDMVYGGDKIRHSDEKILFSEIFYRHEKNSIEKERHQMNMKTLLMLISGFIVLGFFICVFIYGAFFSTSSPSFDSFLGLLVCAAGTLGWISWIIWIHFDFVNSRLTWIEITTNGLKINMGREVKRFISKENLEKIVINAKKERIEIHLKKNNKEKIVLKRDISMLNKHIFTHKQFERFKKAMRQIGVEYEVIYS